MSSFARGAVEVQLSCEVRPIKAAVLCDARERDLEALPVIEGVVRVTMRAALASVRLEL